MCIGIELENNDIANTSPQANTWGPDPMEMEAFLRGLVETLAMGLQTEG